MLALGRPVFLGQLYSGSIDDFVTSPQCWSNGADVKQHTHEDPYKTVTLDYRDTTGLADRSSLLSVKGELEIGILSGAISLSGHGSYLDSSKETISTRETSVACTQYTHVKRLTYDVGAITEDAFKHYQSLGGTHVVTQITYGGCIVATFKEKSVVSDSKMEAGGGFSAKIMKGLGDKLSVEANVEARHEAIEKANKLDVTFNLHADAQIEQTPTNVADVLDLVNQWGKVLKNATVPLKVTVTPLARFVDTTVAGKTLSAMRQSEIETIIKSYDKLITLSGKRATLTAELLARETVFPTLYQRSFKSNFDLQQRVTVSRAKLAEYLEQYRSEGRTKVKGVAEFLKEVNTAYDDHKSKYQKDEDDYKILSTIVTAANNQKIPLVDIDQLRLRMTGTDGALGLVIIPEKPNSNGVNNIFRIQLSRIRAWREKEDKAFGESIAGTMDPRARRGAEASSYATLFAAFYLEPETKAKLLSIDGLSGSISAAVKECEVDHEPRFVHYDFLTADGFVLGRMDWSLLNQDGWGFIINEVEGSSYVGEVKNKIPHGHGSMTYPDKSTYVGRFWHGKRHGLGKRPGEEGVYIDNDFANDGVVVELRVYSGHRVVKFQKVPLKKYDSLHGHVRNIATMMGWKAMDAFLVTIESNRRDSPEFPSQFVKVQGSLIQAGQDPDLPTTTWPLESSSATIRAERITKS